MQKYQIFITFTLRKQNNLRNRRSTTKQHLEFFSKNRYCLQDKNKSTQHLRKQLNDQSYLFNAWFPPKGHSYLN